MDEGCLDTKKIGIKLEAVVRDAPIFKDSFDIPVTISYVELARDFDPKPFTAESIVNKLKDTHTNVCYNGYVLPIFKGDRIRVYGTKDQIMTGKIEPEIIEILDIQGEVKSTYYRQQNGE